MNATPSAAGPAASKAPASPIVTPVVPMIAYPPLPQARYALLIGSTDDAPGSNNVMLPGVRVDVEMLSRLLTEELPPGDRFRVTVHYAEAVAPLQRAIAAYGARLAAVPATQQPVGLLYFAGHSSVQHHRQMLGVGAADVDFEQQVIAVLAQAAPRAIQFVFLDCCRTALPSPLSGALLQQALAPRAGQLEKRRLQMVFGERLVGPVTSAAPPQAQATDIAQLDAYIRAPLLPVVSDADERSSFADCSSGGRPTSGTFRASPNSPAATCASRPRPSPRSAASPRPVGSSASAAARSRTARSACSPFSPATTPTSSAERE